jgi:hypothetical protein
MLAVYRKYILDQRWTLAWSHGRELWTDRNLELGPEQLVTGEFLLRKYATSCIEGKNIRWKPLSW